MISPKRIIRVSVAAIILAGCSYKLVRHDQLNQPYFETIKGRVSAERGLEWIEPVKVEIVSREQVRSMLEEEMDKEYPPEKIKALERAYVRMGLIDPGTDLREVLLKFLTGGTAGFYIPEKKTLFIVKEVAGHASLSGIITRRDTTAELIIAHELTHALDDQHFNLEKMDSAVTDNDDASLALSALEEGVATIVGFAVLYRPEITMDDLFAQVFRFNALNNKLAAILSPGTPASVRDMLLFSYDAGSKFVAHVYRAGGGWDAVNAAYKNPPRSSEQVLHPDKYIAGNDNPEIPDLLVSAEKMCEGWSPIEKNFICKDWNEIERNTMGQFTTESLFRRFLPENEAKAASQGWRGDRYVVMENSIKSQVVWVWFTMWDTEQDATRFVEAYKTLLLQKYPKLSPFQPPGTGINWDAEGLNIWDTNEANQVLLYFPSPGDQFVIIVEGADMKQIEHILFLFYVNSFTSFEESSRFAYMP